MKSIVLCVRHGGFSLSRDAFLRLREMGNPVALAEVDIGEPWDKSKPDHLRGHYLDGFCRSIDRDDPQLLKVVRELGQRAAGSCCELGIAEIPDGVEWAIDDYDGYETVEEVHREWHGEPVPA